MSARQTNRRLFLQGLGGLAVAAPFLGTLSYRSASGAANSAPKRIIVFFTHSGCITNRYFPKKSHGALTQSDYEAMPTLSVLAPHYKKLLMVRGVRGMNEWSFEQTLGQETEPHTQVMNAYFTCCPTDGVSGFSTATGIDPSTPTRMQNGRPSGGRSLDHVIAEQINRSTNPTPLYVGIGGSQNQENNTMTSLSYSTAGVYDHATHSITEQATLYPAIGSSLTIYNNLIGLLGTDSGGAQATASGYQLAAGKNVLDLCRDDLQRLRAQVMSRADKMKLEAWETLLTDTGNMMDLGQVCTQDAAVRLGVTEQAATDGSSTQLDLAMPIMSALAALTALCDDNRVIFMKTPFAHTYSNVEGITRDHEGMEHRQGDANLGGGKCVADINNKLAAIDGFHAASFANLVSLLDGVPEGDGTLLDNTATIWFQQVSDGLAHNLNNLPILQAGGCGGYFKLGCAVNVDDGAEDLSQGNSEALCTDVAGGQAVPSNQIRSTGTPSELANASINKYYCTLMNALGVKAGADGYAAIGGTQEVLKFGYYDDTKDFATFLSDTPLPSTIKDPGEFAALKA